MPYDRSSIRNSERAYQVLREIYLGDEGSYGSKIAEELETTQQVVSEIINKLQELNLITKGKRTQAQYYEINLQAFSNFQKKMLEDSNQSKSDLDKILSNIKDKKLVKEEWKDDNKVELFLQEYVKNRMEKKKISTLEDLLIHDYIAGLSKFFSAKVAEDYPKWLYVHFKEIKFQTETFTDPEISVKEALENID